MKFAPKLHEVYVHKYLVKAGRIAGISWIALIGGATCIAILFWPVSMVIYWATPRIDHWVECDRGTEIFADSPSRALMARGIALSCSGPMAAGGTIYVAIVKKGQEPTRNDEVLAGDWQYVNQARLVWKSDKLLQITLPDDALVYEQKAALGDIAVLIKFESDDPQVRERALRKREGR